MGYYQTGIASVNSTQNAILEILGDLRREQETERKTMEDEKQFETRVTFQNVKVEPSLTATFEIKPIAIACVCTCVNCNRSYEARPRWYNECTRKVLCAFCRGSYERG